jgi:hypothetical protein
MDLSLMQNDTRPPIMMYDVAGAQFEHVSVQAAAGTALFALNKVTDLSIEKCAGLPDTHLDAVEQEMLNGGKGVPAPGSTYKPASPAENLPAGSNTAIPARPPR